MNDETIIILAIAYIVCISILFHWKVNNYFFASLLSAVVGTFLVFASDYLVIGEIGPFTAMAMRNAFIIYLLTSFSIGTPFFLIRIINRRYRKSLKSRTPQSCAP
jgi:hypothetical protein